MPLHLEIPQMYNGKSVTKLGDYFSSTDDDYLNRSVETIELPSTIKSIGNNAFMCYAGLKEIVIREGVTEFGSYSFCYCRLLNDVTFPISLASIGNNAFYGCDALSDITYSGTKAQWEAVEKGKKWKGEVYDDGTNGRPSGYYDKAITIHCVDGDILDYDPEYRN